MQGTRRQYLQASASACFIPVLAGCLGDTTDGDGPPRAEEGTAKPEPTVKPLQSNIITDPEETKWIRAEFKNTTEVDHGRLRVNHDVYDANDEVVDSQEGLVDLVPAGETWRDYGLVFGDRREDAVSVESEILTDDSSLSSSQIESIEVVDSTLHQDYQSGTEIVGEIQVGETEYSQVYLVGLVYTDNGVLRGSVGELINDIGSGETRSFRAAIASNRTPPDREDALPTQHDIYVFEGIP